MIKHVLDASVILAFLHNEVGSDKAFPLLQEGIISTVNLSEILNKSEISLSTDKLLQELASVLADIVAFEKEQANLASKIKRQNKQFGLSLGDTACLALAMHKKLPVYTADRIWSQLDLPIDIHVIR